MRIPIRKDQRFGRALQRNAAAVSLAHGDPLSRTAPLCADGMLTQTTHATPALADVKVLNPSWLPERGRYQLQSAGCFERPVGPAASLSFSAACSSGVSGAEAARQAGLVHAGRSEGSTRALAKSALQA